MTGACVFFVEGCASVEIREFKEFKEFREFKEAVGLFLTTPP